MRVAPLVDAEPSASAAPRSRRRPATSRPTAWWLEKLRHRAAQHQDELDLSEPITFADERERDAAIRFFNAAYRAEESGIQQAHVLAAQMEAVDPELAEALRLYGDEEGWHRALLVEFLDFMGGDIRPMGRVTGTFYRLYARAQRMDTIMLTNLMFETIGSTTYRLTLRNAKHPAVRQMLTILTRDESFHVPLNVHFIREVLKRNPNISRLRLLVIYRVLFVALCASTIASRRRAQPFDGISVSELARAYAEQLSDLFLHERDLALTPPRFFLRLFGIDEAELTRITERVATSVRAAEASADRNQVVVEAL
ncbi:MAG: ferritin-like domain-containing protein [Myxococcota bacterium]